METVSFVHSDELSACTENIDHVVSVDVLRSKPTLSAYQWIYSLGTSTKRCMRFVGGFILKTIFTCKSSDQCICWFWKYIGCRRFFFQIAMWTQHFCFLALWASVHLGYFSCQEKRGSYRHRAYRGSNKYLYQQTRCVKRNEFSSVTCGTLVKLSLAVQ